MFDGLKHGTTSITSAFTGDILRTCQGPPIHVIHVQAAPKRHALHVAFCPPQHRFALQLYQRSDVAVADPTHDLHESSAGKRSTGHLKDVDRPKYRPSPVGWRLLAS